MLNVILVKLFPANKKWNDFEELFPLLKVFNGSK